MGDTTCQLSKLSQYSSPVLVSLLHYFSKTQEKQFPQTHKSHFKNEKTKQSNPLKKNLPIGESDEQFPKLIRLYLRTESESNS